MTVITISRQYASGGDEIARLICDRLGYRFLDKNLMASLGTQAGSVALVQNFIRGTHGQGGAVILGHGGQVALRDLPDMVHVHRGGSGGDTDPARTRKRRIDYQQGSHEQVSVSDQAASGYVKHYYNANPADPSLYDLVINTSKITPVVAADLVIQAMACLPVLA